VIVREIGLREGGVGAAEVVIEAEVSVEVEVKLVVIEAVIGIAVQAEVGVAAPAVGGVEVEGDKSLLYDFALLN